MTENERNLLLGLAESVLILFRHEGPLVDSTLYREVRLALGICQEKVEEEGK